MERWSRTCWLSALASLWLALGPATAAHGDWPAWRGGAHEARAAQDAGPRHWSESDGVAWKTRIPGQGHSSPIVAGDAVYVTSAWKADTDPRLMVGLRWLLWLLLLLTAAPTVASVRARSAPPSRLQNLLGPAGTTLLTATLGGLILYGEALLDFQRAVERGWIAACLGGTLSLTVASLYPSGARRTPWATVALIALSALLWATIPDRAHTIDADPRSDVSRLIWAIVVLPALVGVFRLLWVRPGVARGVGVAALVALAAGVGTLIGRAGAHGDAIQRTISVAEPYRAHLPWWTAPMAGLLLTITLLVRHRRETRWGNVLLLVGSATLAGSLLVTGIERLLVVSPYLAYLAGTPVIWPLTGRLAVWLLVALTLAGGALLPVRPSTLPLVARCAACLLGGVYFLYATVVPRGPRLAHAVVCIDRDTGSIRWKTAGLVASGVPLHSDNTAATPTPVTDGARVFAYFGTPGLLCVDLQGRRLWVNAQLPYKTREGVGSSPILCDGKVVVLCESEAGAFLAAVDARTGKLTWKTARTQKFHDYAGNCRTPTVAKVRGRETIVVWGYEDLTGYDPATGRALWSLPVDDPGTGGNPVASAVTDERNLYLAGAYEATALSLDRLARVWKVRLAEGPQVSTPVVADGRLYGISDNGSAFCLDTTTGKELWRRELEAQHYASALWLGDRVAFFSTKGTATLLDRDGRILSRNPLSGKVFATPAPADDTLFVRTATHLYRLGEGESHAPP